MAYMKLSNKILCVIGFAIIVAIASGYASNEAKYYLHHPKASKQEITEAMYKSYLSGKYRERVRSESAFNLQMAFTAGALCIGLGVIVVGVMDGRRIKAANASEGQNRVTLEGCPNREG
ncbi:hypothetical protein CA264_16080 [Pontibacter actiniarum]|uniref:Uncharacterized protein n=2 Tax=Pontibacter actiniarum TaxID=323450 RepID=A0A1X9YVA8_9BACT|nr:hypothetical protein CA264_16080 [Pontibacter actiniarum]